MDPIAVLQSRIEQLEAKLGLALTNPADGQHEDSATVNLLNAAQSINNATTGHEKLSESMQRATELNNYTDPNFMEKMQQNNMNIQEVAAAEPVLKHHCHCMHRCKQKGKALVGDATCVDTLASSLLRETSVRAGTASEAAEAAPVLESEAIQQVPQLQKNVDKMHAAAAEVKAEADTLSQGIQELAETCGTAASKASEQLTEVAQKVEQVENKMFPRRRNGLD